MRCLPGPRDRLGESPLWDPRDQSLYWVDSKAPQVRRLHPASGEVRSWPVPEDIGSIALTDSGRLLMALASGFHLLDLQSGETTPLVAVQHPKPQMRLNDGRCDRQGRFVAGSLVHGRTDPDGQIYRLDAERRVDVLQSGIAIANSICFSPAGDRMYFADSLSGIVQVCDYDGPSGRVGAARPFVDTRPHGSGPDGATVDAEGGVWVALVLAGRIARFRPDGSLDRLVDLPVQYPTCPCFGGPALDVLYVTSISDSGHRLRSDAPDAGAVVEVIGLKVSGLPEARFADGSRP
ncbi:MAG TPA: SMP-30/gluconolactonase/LRE family protein [Aquabacterium sp.]|nr:SMP-30/gluconolactonase/LRE family protein [Aquabacterium sp.]